MFLRLHHCLFIIGVITCFSEIISTGIVLAISPRFTINTAVQRLDNVTHIPGFIHGSKVKLILNPISKLGHDRIKLDGFSNRNKKVCIGFTNHKIFGMKPGESYTKLKKKFYKKNCTHIEGHLLLANLALNDSNLDFLNQVESISGTLIIVTNYVRRISLPSLKVIRGDGYFKWFGGQRYSLFVYENMELMNLHLPALISIVDHYILFSNNPFLCYAPFTVNWDDILEDVSQQRVFIVGANHCGSAQNTELNRDLYQNRTVLTTQIEKTNLAVCSSSCSVYKGERFCWGANADNCQTLRKCSERICSGVNRCYNSEKAEECCHEECIIGCFGHTADQCVACRNLNNDGVCVPTCPSRTLYDSVQFLQVPNPNFRIRYGSTCVVKCPVTYIRDDDICVLKCTRPNTMEENGACVPCPGGICPKVCKFEDIEPDKPKEIALRRRSLQNMQHCTTFEGDLKITDHSFYGDKYHNTSQEKDGARWEDLIMLRNLQNVKGFFHIEIRPDWIKNLTFLENLQEVKFLQISQSNHVEFLGLRSLKSISKRVIIGLNERLCYFPIKLPSSVGPYKQIHNGKKCRFDEHKCHPLCDPNYGCWGPGPYQCVLCTGKLARNNFCVSNCTSALGYMSPMNGFTMAARTKSLIKCQECHPECRPQLGGTCSGTLARQCLAGCRTMADGPVCVSKCPVMKYPDLATRKCTHCSPTCSQSSINPHKPMCSGPRDCPGLRGCQLCKHVILSPITRTIDKCLLANESCPSGTYAKMINLAQRLDITNIEHLQSDPLALASLMKWLTQHVEMNFYLVRACLPCHPLCAECEDHTRHKCDRCKFFRMEGSCVKQCVSYGSQLILDVSPENGTSLLTDDYSEVSGNSSLTSMDNVTFTEDCQVCHDECRVGCHGTRQQDCTYCQNVKLYLNKENTKWLCLLRCPETEPYRGKESSTGDTVCSSIQNSKSLWSFNQHSGQVLAAFISGLLFILIIIICFFTWLIRKRQNKRGGIIDLTEMDRYLQEELQPMTPSAAPNMNVLLIMPEDQLERGGIIGSGAFGTVYRGLWATNWRTLTQNNPEAICPPENHEGEQIRLPVAIKVLSDTSDSSNNKEILEEAKIMASVDHSCCLRVIGLCLTSRPQLVTQFMALGCLLDYVRSHQTMLGGGVLLRWAKQIASGMSYLESRGIIHRDLAARNVLVQSPKQIRITDFGLAKFLDVNEQEYRAKGGQMPIKWLAIESIQHRLFSHKSDVWAYGVTLWEVFTFGQRPYQTIPPYELLRHLERGERLTQPTICSIDIYTILVQCWLVDPESRPSFNDLIDKFGLMAADPARYLVVNLDYSMNTNDNLSSYLSSEASQSPPPSSTVDEMSRQNYFDQYQTLLDSLSPTSNEVLTWEYYSRYIKLTVPADFRFSSPLRGILRSPDSLGIVGPSTNDKRAANSPIDEEDTSGYVGVCVDCDRSMSHGK